nr:hypothetical protein [Dendronalium sp. ChiSLP03b]MDZ8205989.1 hypothetical protein [Dendronalium sp. ChiSLP03b]
MKKQGSLLTLILSQTIAAIPLSSCTVDSDKILIPLPKIKEPVLAQRMLESTVQLEFRTQKPGTETELYALQVSRAELKLKQQTLRNSTDKAAIAKNLAELQKNNQAIAQLFTSTNPPLTNRYIKDAYAQPNQNKYWDIAIGFDQKGSELFAQVTKSLAGTGRSLGIFLNNELISSPVISQAFAATGITGGQAVITGKFTAQQANDLSVQLRGGGYQSQ